jgi:ATP-binding cassette subfamily B protein
MKAKNNSIKNESATLYPYIHKYRLQYILGFLCLILVDGAQMIIPQFIKRAINIISTGSFLAREVLVPSAAMAGTMLIIAGGRFCWRYFIHGSSRRIEAELREKLFSHLLTLNWDFYEKYKIGDLLARSTNDLSAIRMAIGWGLVAGVDGLVMTSAILVIMFVENASTAILAVLPLPLITILMICFGKMLGKRFKRAQENYSSLSDTVQETFAGIHVVKSFVQESFFVKKFADNNEDYKKANMSVVKLHGAFFPFVTFLAGLTTLAMLLAGGRNVVLGNISPGSLVALLSYIQMLIWPLLGAGFTVNMLQRGIVSLRRINEILRTEPSIKNENNRASPVAPDSGLPLIELKEFSFAYRDGKNILQHINLKIEKGSHLGIFGRTGSGKSTLIKMFPRILDPPRGTVFIKGIDVRDWDLQELRALFGLSPQESQLFSDTIENNIAYGLEHWERDEINYIADLASLNRDIQNFKEGLDTLVGERGITLSGGQKQRITIARAVIMKPEILILDDSFSALDAETEKKILSFVNEARKGKTTIIISHRTFAFSSSDNVAVLEDGKITEYGPPSALQTGEGYYAKIARLQQLEK